MSANKPEHNLQDLDKIAALALRSRLLRYLDDLRTDISELAEGLQIARPTMQKFINADDETIEFPPISRSKIYHLWEALTSPSKIDPKQCTRRYRRHGSDPESLSTQDIRDRAIENRTLLKQRGPDELMIAAGFLPVHTKWIGVSPERYPQLMQMVLLLDSDILGFDSFMKVTQTQLEETIKAFDNEVESMKIHRDEEDTINPSEIIRQRLKINPTIEPILRGELYKKYDKACSRIFHEGYRERLSVEEALGLFSTILSNELNQKERLNLKFRVLNLEFKPLSLNLAEGDNYLEIRQTLKKVSIAAENELNTGEGLKAKSLSVDSKDQFIPSVVQASITCSYSPESISGKNIESRENIVFSYISSSTTLNLVAKAVALHLGFKESIQSPEVGTKKFGNKMASLVKCTATLECDNNGSHVQGDWVDRDFLKAYVQSLLIAGEKWLFFQINSHNFHPQSYLTIFQKMSSLEQQLNEGRKSFHNYQFSEDSATPTSLEQIAQEASATFKKYIYPQPSNPSWKTFEINFNRIYLLAKIHKLRLVNMQGNLSEARKLIAEIGACIEEREIDKFLRPISTLFRTEQKLYELSAGHNTELFSGHSDYWENWLNEAKCKINNNRKLALSPLDPYYPSDPDIDIYQCLGTIHSIAGRWLFYLGTTSSELTLASDYFFRAAHYFSRIGLAQRVARCLAIAGRAKIRMGQYETSKQLRELAYDLVRIQLHEGQREAFKQSALSEIYLLEGEYELHAKANYMRGLELSLQGLKGAMWLGLARRSSDNLYNIWQCAQHLGDKTVEPLLKKVFPVLWAPEDINSRNQKRERLNPLENRIADEVIERLFEIQRRSRDQTWHQVAHQFQRMSSHIWHRWYRDADKSDALGQHPIGQLIDDNLFLRSVS